MAQGEGGDHAEDRAQADRYYNTRLFRSGPHYPKRERAPERKRKAGKEEKTLSSKRRLKTMTEPESRAFRLRHLLFRALLTNNYEAISCRAITNRCTSLVPSPMVQSFESRQYFSAG